jgi:hypothetical protein
VTFYGKSHRGFPWKVGKTQYLLVHGLKEKACQGI